MGIHGITEIFLKDGRYHVITGHRINENGREEDVMEPIEVEKTGEGILKYNVDGKLPPRKIEELVSQMDGLPGKPFAFHLGNSGLVKDYMTDTVIEFYKITGYPER